jgi:hypothetical protein
MLTGSREVSTESISISIKNYAHRCSTLHPLQQSRNMLQQNTSFDWQSDILPHHTANTHILDLYGHGHVGTETGCDTALSISTNVQLLASTLIKGFDFLERCSRKKLVFYENNNKGIRHKNLPLSKC